MKKRILIQLNKLIKESESKRFLIAASGGLDSTVLIYLCLELKLDFAICHVNFKLRNKESDNDQKFLEELAESNQIPIYVLEENTKIFSSLHNLSIQEAARQIRYNWFEKCLKEYNYDYVMTAHHADDNLETYLINSFRGTGIKGLTGIPPLRNNIIRPLLDFTREDILAYAENKKISWREDESNTSDKYLRNVIRHHLTPFFRNKHDNLYARFDTTINNINRQESLLEDYLGLIFKQAIDEMGDSYRLKIDVLKQFPNYQNILIELLKNFGFTDWDSVVDLLDAQVGKYVSSSSHKLVKERGFLELFLINNYSPIFKTISIESLPKTIEFDEGKLDFKSTSEFHKSQQNIAFLSKDLLKSDLYLRTYKIGDYFCPLGMSGRRKLSDFLKDEKLTTLEKSKVWVLVHNEDIIWVINHRIDERYKITENTQECLKITFLPNV